MSNCPTCGRPKMAGTQLVDDYPCIWTNDPECIAVATVALYWRALEWIEHTGGAGRVRRAIEVAKRGCPELHQDPIQRALSFRAQPAPSPAETTAKPTCRTCHDWKEQKDGMGTCMATVTPAYETDSCEGHEPSPAETTETSKEDDK
jgi:hypothetical protein